MDADPRRARARYLWRRDEGQGWRALHYSPRDKGAGAGARAIPAQAGRRERCAGTSGSSRRRPPPGRGGRPPPPFQVDWDSTRGNEPARRWRRQLPSQGFDAAGREPRDSNTAIAPTRSPVRPQQRFYQQQVGETEAQARRVQGAPGRPAHGAALPAPHPAPGDQGRPARGDPPVPRAPGRPDPTTDNRAGRVPLGSGRPGQRADRRPTEEARALLHAADAGAVLATANRPG